MYPRIHFSFLYVWYNAQFMLGSQAQQKDTYDPISEFCKRLKNRSQSFPDSSPHQISEKEEIHLTHSVKPAVP